MIPYGRQTISEEDIEAVTNVLRSDWLTQGPAVSAFEQAVLDFCGARFAVAVNSATSALEIACQALGLKDGGLLWTVPNTFVASANCGCRCGADVDFIDIEPDTHNLSVRALTEKLQSAKIAGRLPDIVVAVHFAGHSCEMESIHRLSQEYNFRVIEDASHAIGGSYKETVIGSCRWSDITVFSFHPVKIVTSGEGGMSVTNDPDLAHRMALLRSHGITKDPAYLEQKDCGIWYYEQQILGANYRMTDIQAALAVSQLSKLSDFLSRRREIVAIYNKGLAELSAISLPVERRDTKSAWHLYTIEVQGGDKERRRMFDHLRSEGLGVQVHYLPVHLQPYYREMGFSQGDFPIAENYSNRTISLPLFPSMTDEDIQTIISVVTQACSDILS